MNMTQMIEAVKARQVELQKTSEYEVYMAGKAFEIEGVGKVWCGIQIAQGATTWMRPHWRKNWKLDGKVIAASKLEKLVGA
mgnify:FL=1|jgi:hypothetical protein